MFFVYRYIDTKENRYLYVGKTENLYKRHVSHLYSGKEEWCNKDLRLEYKVLPDKYNMDFYEIYIINKLNPIHNVAAKKSMDISNIHFSYDSEWKCYDKEQFKKDFISKNNEYGVSYILDKNTIEILKIWGLNPKVEYCKDDKKLYLKFSEGIIEKYLKQNNCKLNRIVLDVVYNCIRICAMKTIISFEQDFNYPEYSFILQLDELKKMEDNLLNPDEDMKLLNKDVNYFLSLMGINCTWKDIYLGKLI